MSRSKTLRGTPIFTGLLALTLGGVPAMAQSSAVEPGWRGGFVAEEIDLRRDDAGHVFSWDAAGYIGGARYRAWLRTEGEERDEAISSERFELLLGRSFVAGTEILFGARHDSGTLTSRTYAAFGLQNARNRALQWDATGYLGESARSGRVHLGLRTQLRQSWQLSDRWSLRARAEAEIWTEDHGRTLGGPGSGPSELRAGLRIGYAVNRNVACHVGGEWLYQLQDTAELNERIGGDARSLALVAGLRVGI